MAKNNSHQRRWAMCPFVPYRISIGSMLWYSLSLKTKALPKATSEYFLKHSPVKGSHAGN